jgi:hypothetical protein
VSELISTLKDAGFLIGFCIAGWKARAVIQPLIAFFDRAQKHMDTMEAGISGLQTGVNTLLTNHLSHMEQDLKTLSGRKESFVHALVDVDPLLEK